MTSYATNLTGSLFVAAAAMTWLGWVDPPDEPPSLERGGQLYNLADDPREQCNLYGEQTEIVEQLRALLQSYREDGRSAP